MTKCWFRPNRGCSLEISPYYNFLVAYPLGSVTADNDIKLPSPCMLDVAIILCVPYTI